MSKPIKINLNEYERVPTIDDLEGYQSVTSYMLKDGTQPTYSGRVRRKNLNIRCKALSGTRISVLTTKYQRISIKLVDWWFSEVSRMWRNLSDTFFNGFDL